MLSCSTGLKKSSNPEKNAQALIKFIIPLEVLDFDYNAAIKYGLIRTDLEKRGIPIGPLDTMIAAHCFSQGLTLITNNEKEFVRVPGLKVENWVEEL